MNAEQMFERLGYTRNLDSKKLIYTKASETVIRNHKRRIQGGC